MSELGQCALNFKEGIEKAMEKGSGGPQERKEKGWLKDGGEKGGRRREGSLVEGGGLMKQMGG